MEEVIRAAGRTPRQRTTLYGGRPEERVAASFAAAPLAPADPPPYDDGGLQRPAELVRPGLAAADSVQAATASALSLASTRQSASTTIGSSCVPALRRSSSSASSRSRASRYGRISVIAL